MNLFRTLMVTIFLGFGTVLLLFLERKASARAQHRVGPNQAGALGEWQILADLMKVYGKWWRNEKSLGSMLLSLTLPVQLALPIVFMAILLGAWHLGIAVNVELLFLLLLLVFSIVLEALYLQVDSSPTEKYEYRRYVATNLLGICALLLSVATIILHTGSLSLRSTLHFQAQFPYHAIFMSPGLFIAAINAFLSFFYILAVSPVGEMGVKSILGRRQYLYFLYKRMWIFTLACFWIFLFAGAMGDFWGFLWFTMRLVIFLIILVVLQSSIPKLRISDAMEIGIRFLLPIGLCGLIMEIFWLAWWME